MSTDMVRSPGLGNLGPDVRCVVSVTRWIAADQSMRVYLPYDPADQESVMAADSAFRQLHEMCSAVIDGWDPANPAQSAILRRKLQEATRRWADPIPLTIDDLTAYPQSKDDCPDFDACAVLGLPSADPHPLLRPEIRIFKVDPAVYAIFEAQSAPSTQNQVRQMLDSTEEQIRINLFAQSAASRGNTVAFHTRQEQRLLVAGLAHHCDKTRMRVVVVYDSEQSTPNGTTSPMRVIVAPSSGTRLSQTEATQISDSIGGLTRCILARSEMLKDLGRANADQLQAIDSADRAREALVHALTQADCTSRSSLSVSTIDADGHPVPGDTAVIVEVVAASELSRFSQAAEGLTVTGNVSHLDTDAYASLKQHAQIASKASAVVELA